MEEKLRSSWTAYASLLVADDQGSMDVDTLIITHDRLLFVELKEWNGRLESEEGKWFLNGKNTGKSPYEVKRVHAIRLAKLLQKELQHKLGYYPIVEAHVVLCGTATPDELSTSERRYVHTLDDFLEITTTDGYAKITANQVSIVDRLFNRGSSPRPNNTVHCLPVFKSFFEGSRVKPKVFLHHDYVANEKCWFEHHNHIYREYKAKNVEEPLLQGLIRRWDFTRLGTGKATQEQWEMIALRERRVLDYARRQSSHLEDLMLRPIVPLTSEDVREDCTELYDLRKTYQRLDEHIALYAREWSREKRADLVRALLVPFSELHGLDLGHRDIDGHNLWYAPEHQSVVTSGYANAFFPEKGTIQDLRKVMQSSYLKLPEDACSMEGEILDPFRQDVYMLAVIAYQICFDGKQPLREEGIPVWSAPEVDAFEGKLDEWFSIALNWEATDRFANAAEMLARFNQLTRDDAPLHTDKQDVFDSLMSGNFVKRNIGIFTLYSEYPPEPGENPGGGQKLVYKSTVGDNRYLCKVWPYFQVSVESVGLNRKLSQFKKRLELLSGSHLHIPQIKDFGLFEGGGLYVVSEFLNGDTWDVEQLTQLTEIERLHLALALIKAIMGLHSLNLAHGDIQPDNLLVDIQINTETGFSVFVNLIDIADFSEESEIHNTEYGPTNPSVTDAFGRDRVGCYLLVQELLGPSLPQEIEGELNRGLCANAGVPPSITPLEAAIQSALTARDNNAEQYPINESQIALAWGHSSFPATKRVLEQDEGRYLFNCKWDEQRTNTLKCYITGISSQLTIALKLDEKERKVDRISLKDHVPLSEVVRASNQVQQDITTKISVRYGNMDEQTEMQIIDLILSFDVVLTLLADRFGSAETEQPGSEGKGDHIPPTNLWSALIESEEKILQTIEIESGEILENSSGNLLIPYNSQSRSLDFEDDEEIFVSEIGEDSHLGELVINETNREILSLHPRRPYVRKTLRRGMILQLESLRNKASRDRRSKALARVVNNEAIIGNLPDYFDTCAATNSQDYLEPPTEQEIREIYDTDDFSMNERQIEAFQWLIRSGPMGVLQGPPGTGKTAFISKFIHYLFARMEVQNILLVGQSHTAVDNVAVKAREVCLAHHIELDIVRIGQEQMIDEDLLHAHPSSLQRQLRHRFHREYDQRISSLSRHLLLPQDLVIELCFLHRTLVSLIQNRHHLVSIVEESAINGSGVIDVSDDAHKIKSLEDRILVILDKHFSGEFVFEFEGNRDLWDEVSIFVAKQHGVNNPSAVSRLNQLLLLSQDWMDVLYTGEANYDSFLVNTRQLVCGTLVGMGLKRLEIETKIFDWVIVDEAGRAQASELMVALQCARRILLVGDHKQLPPLYDKTQLKLAASKLGTSVEVFDQSDFHRAFTINSGITLDTQYRMVQPIGDLVSTCFYAEEIKSLKTGRGDSPSWYSALPRPLNKPVCWIDSSSSQNKIGEEEPEKGKFINLTEMELTLRILQRLAAAGQGILDNLHNTVSNGQPFPIGIITMYRAQKELLENEISKSELISPIRGLIKIDTVDSYQGQENKIVILSLVRDNRKKLQGFLRDSPRINVAISRAQERLVILGATNMWDKGNTDSSLSKVLGVVRDMAQRTPESYALVSAKSVIGTGV